MTSSFRVFSSLKYSICSLRKQPTFRDTNCGFPAKWHLNNKSRNFILMTRRYPDLQSWAKVLGHFCFSGAFFIHTGPTPPLTPQTMLDACIQNFFRVSTFYRVGGTTRKFRERRTVLRGNREMTEKYEYCSTVPRTFVQDCRYCLWLIMPHGQFASSNQKHYPDLGKLNAFSIRHFCARFSDVISRGNQTTAKAKSIWC